MSNKVTLDVQTEKQESNTLPNVSIIILNWNGLKDTPECLESLKKLDYPNYKIIIVDNGSTDGSQKILKEKFPYITLIENPENLGFAEGNNVGIRHALRKGTDYVFLLNNDTIIDKNLLKELVKVAERNPEIGVVGSKIYRYDKPNVIENTIVKINFKKGKLVQIGIGEVDKGQFDEIKEVDMVSGCALLTKRGVIEEVGMLDPIYFIYYEEVDWCTSVRKAGYKIFFAPGAKVWHKGSKSTEKISTFRGYLWFRNQIIFVRRHANPTDKIVFFFYFFGYRFPRFFIGAIIRVKFNLAWSYIKGVGWHLFNKV